jgi:hypothetical protein
MTDVEESKVLSSALYKGAAQFEAEAEGNVVDTRMKFAAETTQPEATEDQKLDKEIEDAQVNGTLGEQEKSWAKRYGDLRRHEAKALADKDASHTRDMDALRQEIQATSLGTSELTDDEMIAFADQNPDAMKVMRSVNRRDNAKRDSEVQELKDELSKAKETATKEQAKSILFEKHPNWEEVTSSDAFHNWADSQPKAVQAWVFENPDDGELLSKAIDFYLAETGTKKTKKRNPSQNAATLVKTGGSSAQVQAGGERTYKLSWINGLKDSDYTDGLQADIRKALVEGRVEDDT